MPTVLVKDVLFDASTLMLDASPQFKRWTQREMVGYLNEAQLIISRLMPVACTRVDVVKLKPGTRQRLAFDKADVKRGDGKAQAIDVQGIQLIDMLRNMGDDGASPGRPVRIVSQRALDLSAPDWHKSLGKEVREFVYAPKVPDLFMVYPGVPAAPRAVWIELEYTAIPDLLAVTADYGASTATISIGDEYAPDLKNYIVSRANMKEASYADPGKAQSFAGLFTTSMNAKVETLTGVNPNLKRLPLATDIGGSK